MRPVFKLHILIVALLGFSALASAEVTLSETRTWRRARLINGGQQVWSFRTSYQKITDRYSNDGSVEPMGQRYSRALTWGQLVNAENSEEGRADMRAYMNQRRLNDDQIAATARYEVEREDLGVAAEWAYGLTKRWMIGAQIPLTYRRTRVSSRIEMTPQLAQGGGDINQKSVLKFKNDELRGKVNELAERELANSGYDEIPDEQQSLDWGDVALLSQFALYESSDVTWSLQQLVRFPTAQSPSVAEYIQTTSDDGNMDVGLTSLADYRLRRWTFGGRLGYVAQLPDTTRMRVSNTDADSKIGRDLGDWIWGAVDADWRVGRSFGLEFEYAFLAKSQDRYSGDAVALADERLLADNTEQEIHQTRLGMVYNIAGFGSRSGVDNKWVASVGYTQPWIGRNSVDAGRTTLEIISYF